MCTKARVQKLKIYMEEKTQNTLVFSRKRDGCAKKWNSATHEYASEHGAHINIHSKQVAPHIVWRETMMIIMHPKMRTERPNGAHEERYTYTSLNWLQTQNRRRRLLLFSRRNNDYMIINTYPVPNFIAITFRFSYPSGNEAAGQVICIVVTPQSQTLRSEC
jgi:hypothetical protein